MEIIHRIFKVKKKNQKHQFNEEKYQTWKYPT